MAPQGVIEGRSGTGFEEAKPPAPPAPPAPHVPQTEIPEADPWTFVRPMGTVDVRTKHTLMGEWVVPQDYREGPFPRDLSQEVAAYRRDTYRPKGARQRVGGTGNLSTVGPDPCGSQIGTSHIFRARLALTAVPNLEDNIPSGNVPWSNVITPAPTPSWLWRNTTCAGTNPRALKMFGRSEGTVVRYSPVRLTTQSRPWLGATTKGTTAEN